MDEQKREGPPPTETAGIPLPAPPPSKSRRLLKWPAIAAAVIGLLALGIREITTHAIVGASWHEVEKLSKLFHKTGKPQQRWRVLAVFPDPSVSTVSVPIVHAMGFVKDLKQLTLIDDVDFVLIPEAHTPADTAALVKAEIDKGDVLAVVGHERSTTVRELDEKVYQNESVIGQTPMPLILPAATNPLLTAGEAPGQEHILRLPATDAKQITCIRMFIQRMLENKYTSKKELSVGIIRDRSNPAYSDYIGDEFVAQSDQVDQSIGADLGGSDIPSSIVEHDVVVVAGMERLAKVLLRRLRRWKVDINGSPELVFTDGVAGEVFYNATHNLISDPPKREEYVWMSGPFEPNVPKGELLSDKPDYASYGALARSVLEQLLRDAKSRHDNRLSRQAVLETLQWWLRDAARQPSGVIFDARGDNTVANFHIYKITNGKTYHSRYCCCAH